MAGTILSKPLAIDGVAKHFGDVVAVQQISLDVAAGEFLTLLGPSGSGKTTLLKIIAGFEEPTQGSVRMGDVDITHHPPGQRNIGMVFQNYALFPHLTVERNVGFPLSIRKVPVGEIRKRVKEALTMVELDGYQERYPSQLSGGQQQRVALARAVVFNPGLLLLDEPFGALDRRLRQQLQEDVRRLQKRLGLTTIFVTHDQDEALLMSDRIAVMNHGVVEQLGEPHEIYTNPATLFAAGFIGESNIWHGQIAEMSGDGCQVLTDGGRPIWALAGVPGKVVAVVRPENILLVESGDADNERTALIKEISYLGQYQKYIIDDDSHIITAHWPISTVPVGRLAVGSIVKIGWKRGDVHVIPV